MSPLPPKEWYIKLSFDPRKAHNVNFGSFVGPKRLVSPIFPLYIMSTDTLTLSKTSKAKQSNLVCFVSKNAEVINLIRELLLVWVPPQESSCFQHHSILASEKHKATLKLLKRNVSCFCQIDATSKSLKCNVFFSAKLSF